MSVIRKDSDGKEYEVSEKYLTRPLDADMTTNDRRDQILDDFLAGWSDGSDINEKYRVVAREQINQYCYDTIMEIVNTPETTYKTMQPVSPLFARNELRANIRQKAKERLL